MSCLCAEPRCCDGKCLNSHVVFVLLSVGVIAQGLFDDGLFSKKSMIFAFLFMFELLVHWWSCVLCFAALEDYFGIH